MGQQQLLLIVLGVIIVGIAVVVGINVFTASSLQANNDAVIADLTTIGSLAQQHYRKPNAMGGGGNSFDGSTVTGTQTPHPFAVPVSLQQTANMSIPVVCTPTATDVTLVAQGTETISDGTTLLSVTVRVTSDNIEVMSTNVNN